MDRGATSVSKKTFEAIVSANEPEPVVARRKPKKSGSDIYPATFRIPRPTAERLIEVAKQRETSLQGLMEEAMDRWMRSENEGVFFPDGWDPETGRKIR
jgi:hypothetical protein